MAGLAFFYLFVYRRFFSSKSVMNSAIYHYTINFNKQNDRVLKTLGSHLQIMNCNGKIKPLKSNVDFDLIIFGSNQKGKVNVHSEYDKVSKEWTIKNIELHTRNEKV
jgi:hypothetical protein